MKRKSITPLSSVCHQITIAMALLMSMPADACDDDSADIETLAPTTTLETVSELDGHVQKIVCWAPDEAKSKPTPLFVFLHSWSADYTQDNEKWLRACAENGWIWLHPNFRGVNNTPAACGSSYARQDVLDAVRLARQTWNVDSRRIYLAGVSGGGHMSLLMAGHHPECFSAVSAWVGPTDLAEWHRFHTRDGRIGKYAQMIEQSLGGPPGSSPEIDAEYQDRSPVFHLHQTGNLPVSIWTGIEDGHSGSVPVSHSLRGYQKISEAAGAPDVTDDEIEQLVHAKKLRKPRPEDTQAVPELPVNVVLNRRSGPSRMIVFEGGHESFPEAAFAWLRKQERDTKE